jgi:hypothetical protein
MKKIEKKCPELQSEFQPTYKNTMRVTPLMRTIPRLSTMAKRSWWQPVGAARRMATESAGKAPKFSVQTVLGNGANSPSRCGGGEPAMVMNLEKKTLDELKDLHVDTVDEDEDDAIVVDGKHTFSWKVNAPPKPCTTPALYGHSTSIWTVFMLTSNRLRHSHLVFQSLEPLAEKKITGHFTPRRTRFSGGKSAD